MNSQALIFIWKVLAREHNILEVTWDREFYLFPKKLFFNLGYFLPFCPFNTQKNQNLKKMKKAPGDIIILHMVTKNYDHMMYRSLDMVCNRWMDGWKKWHRNL